MWNPRQTCLVILSLCVYNTLCQLLIPNQHYEYNGGGGGGGGLPDVIRIGMPHQLKQKRFT